VSLWTMNSSSTSRRKTSASEIIATHIVVFRRDVLLTSQSAHPSRLVTRMPYMSRFPLTIEAIETNASSPTNGSASAKATASANATASAVEENEDAGQTVADSLVASLDLKEVGSAIHTAIKVAFDCHVVLMTKNRQTTKMAKKAARGEAYVVDELCDVFSFRR
jgi:hypothetical protein